MHKTLKKTHTQNTDNSELRCVLVFARTGKETSGLNMKVCEAIQAVFHPTERAERVGSEEAALNSISLRGCFCDPTTTRTRTRVGDLDEPP